MPDITEITTHEALGLARLLQQFRAKDRIEAIVEVIGERAQVLETDFFDLIEDCFLANAVGAQLDQYGALLGLPRGTASDTRYRALLGAQVRVIYSSGTPDELLAILALLADVAITVTSISEPPPATIRMEYIGTAYSGDTEWGLDIARKIVQARSPGVDIDQIVEAPSSSFRFDTAGQGFDEGVFAVDLATEAGI